MKVNVNSNGYTFAFAGILVIVVAALLSFAATSLKPQQDMNVELEKKQNILKSINISVERDGAAEAYSTYIQQELVLQNGAVVENPAVGAFDLDMAKELSKSDSERLYPLFVANVEGQTFYILPMRGKGLWGPIWGYVALKEDANTVYGANFDHKSETPGLGAEISTAKFQAQFPGKKVYNEGEIALSVVKPGLPATDYTVDGISGGTITSNGLGDMLKDCIAGYTAYFNAVKEQAAPAAEPVEVPADSLAVDSTALVTEAINL